MSKTRKRFLKLMSLLVVCVICINFCSVISYAAEQIKWELVRTDGPSSEWVTKRNYKFKATRKYILIECKRSKDAVVHARMPSTTENEDLIHSHLVATSKSSTDKAIKGDTYIMTVSYENYGTGYNNPYGYIYY